MILIAFFIQMVSEYTTRYGEYCLLSFFFLFFHQSSKAVGSGGCKWGAVHECTLPQFYFLKKFKVNFFSFFLS
jgi:hypothetical protein